MFSHIFVGVTDFDRALAFWPEHHGHCYGAYFRDPDGNKLCVACHAAE